MKRTLAIMFAAMPMFWSVRSMDSTQLIVRLAPLPMYDTVGFDTCLPGGAYSVGAWYQDSAWHGIAGTFKVCPRGDLNGDGIINAVDVVMVVKLVYGGIPRSRSGASR